MKKVIFGLFALSLLLVACEQESADAPLQETSVDMSDFTLKADLSLESQDLSRKCHSMQVLERQLKEDPGLADRMFLVEQKTRAILASRAPGGNGNGNGNGNGGGGGDTGGGGDPVDDGLGNINIPVVVHVVYNTANPAENISLAQIQSQIDVLNADFRATNSDVSGVPAEFAGVVADSDINFTLDQVIRVASTRSSWGTNDAVKFSANGGSDVVSPSTHMNIWVANIGGGILGYAQFPGGSASTDGIVVAPQFFGDTGYVSAPFDKGRTTTHEVGHYLNLRHIWGDGRCNRDDFVSDTPKSDRPNYGCPNYPTNHCRSSDMFMNYMDYVDDRCMFMFSEGQKARMRALFAAGGAREDIYL
ncbi:zinc metalloprotease [Gilvibacter sp.]|uniref:zinc metalloprotease n=1 Tax=Gilvibacter sp. TaxID=2729997 RepID=UPI003B51A660